MTPVEARFAVDFRREIYDPIVTTFRRDGVQYAAYQIITGGEEASFATFAASLEDVRYTLNKLGAERLAEPARGELLDDALPRALLAALGDWADKWAKAQATADKVGVDVAAWDRALRDWSEQLGFREPGAP